MMRRLPIVSRMSKGRRGDAMAFLLVRVNACPPRELTLIVGWPSEAGGSLGMVLRKGDDGFLAEGGNCSMWCWRGVLPEN